MVQFELPPELVTAETQGQADEMVERGLGSGMSEDEIQERQDEIFATANQRAQTNLKTDFILQRIAEKEEIQLTQDELANRVAAMANQAKKPIKSFAKEIQQSGQLRNIQHSMLLSKTIDFLLEHAKVEGNDPIVADPIDDADAAGEPEEAPAEAEGGAAEPSTDSTDTTEEAEESSNDDE